MLPVKMNLPDFVRGRPVYECLNWLMKNHPETILPNTEIGSIFGCFPWCIWNGGGLDRGGEPFMRERMEEFVHFYNFEMHVPIRLTFTNPLITEEHLNDVYGNLIAEVCHNGHNEILTSSPVLEDYLRKKYPNYKYCKSIIASRDVAIDLDDKYDLVVARRAVNNDWAILDTIPNDKRGSIEFLCTDPCPINCPRIYTHYRAFARMSLEYTDIDCDSSCSMQEVKGPFQRHYMASLPTTITREMIDKDYLPKGFNQFKVSGRGTMSGPVMAVLNYVLKPEYHDDFIVDMLEKQRELLSR